MSMSPGEPLVSVMMPAYNAAGFIREAVESVLAQSYEHWELIVVNDGSTDETARVLEQFRDPRIRIVHQTNAGEAVARNNALRTMQGELVAFLDADDVFMPQHLALTTAYLAAHPEHDAVYTDGYYCDQKGQRLQALSVQRRGPFQGHIFEQVVRASDVFGPPTCVVLRRRVIQEHDLSFDPQIVIGPDWDFLTHYAQWGRFGNIAEHTCLYRIHETNVTVRVDLRRRALYLARCREKAIRLPAFSRCSPETRYAVFYDLLIELLSGDAPRQTAITRQPAFAALPAQMQAQLLRLMASNALLLQGERQEVAEQWLQQARELNPGDRRAALLASLYRFTPRLARWFLRLKRSVQPTATTPSPFSNLR